MPKFNTNSIKEHFTTYLLNNKDKLFDDLGFHYFHNPAKTKLDKTDLEYVEMYSEEFHCKNDALSVADGFYNEFSNIKKWSRDSKEKTSLDDYLSEEEIKIDNSALIDVCGEVNEQLIQSVTANTQTITRTFTPKNDHLGDSFRLEFITLADDSDFLFWTIIVD